MSILEDMNVAEGGVSKDRRLERSAFRQTCFCDWSLQKISRILRTASCCATWAVQLHGPLGRKGSMRKEPLARTRSEKEGRARDGTEKQKIPVATARRGRRRPELTRYVEKSQPQGKWREISAEMDAVQCGRKDKYVEQKL